MSTEKVSPPRMRLDANIGSTHEEARERKGGGEIDRKTKAAPRTVRSRAREKRERGEDSRANKWIFEIGRWERERCQERNEERKQP